VSKTRNAAHDTYKSASNIRKKWPPYGKKCKKIRTGHGEKKILKKVCSEIASFICYLMMALYGRNI
jgi:hypothetical protein